MQNTLRKWLVGIGLMVALLALAVPAAAQNQWQVQAVPATFPTPVTAMTVGPANQVEAVTAGGGYPGGLLGRTYYDNTGVGTPFNIRTAAGDPPGDDYTSVQWDGAVWFGGAWNTGLWDYNGTAPGVFTNPTLTAPLWVNKHVQCFTVDPDNAGVPYPHMLYIGTWGDGIYTFDGTTWVKLALYPGATPAQFVRKIALKSNGAGFHPDIYAGTDGYGVVKGTWTAGAWAWTQVFTGDLYITALGVDGGGNVYAGTRTIGIYQSNDNGATWVPMASNPVITTPVSAVISTPAGLFAGTEGQGVYRYDATKAFWLRIDNQGCAGGATVDLYVNDLAFEAANNTLFVGAGQQILGAVGNVYRIAFANPTTAEPANHALVVGTYENHILSVIPALICSPTNWSAQIIAGGLPPSMSLVVDNPPTLGAPAVRVEGTPTAACHYPVTIRVWDALYNWVDIIYTNDVQLRVPAINIVSTPTPLGTVMSFSTDSPATLGVTGSISYIWNFGDGVPFPAVDSTLAAPTHIYANPGIYTVTLWVSDSACPGGAAACPATSPDNCNTTLAEVYGPLTVDPSATIVGSGSQFQFHPTPFGSAMGGLPVCTTSTTSGVCPAPVGPVADGYTYDWRFYIGIAPPPTNPPSPTPPAGWISQSCDSNPIVTFTSTGAFWAWLHVTDCSGHDAYGYCVVNYNGPMSMTISSDTNPASTIASVNFAATALGCNTVASYTFDVDFGDGSPVSMGNVVATPPFPVVYNFAHNYPTPGTYVVMVTAHDDICGHSTIVSYQQVIYAAFTGITVTRTGDCTAGYPTGPVPNTVNFNVTPIGGMPPYMLSVDWNDGSTTSYTGLIAPWPHAVSHTYTTAGQYTPVFYMTDSGHIPVTQTQPGTLFSVGTPLTGTVTPACQQVLQSALASWTITRTNALSAGFADADYQYYLNYGDGFVSGWVPFVAPTAVPTHAYAVLPGVQHYQPTWYLRNMRNCQQIGPFGGLDVWVYNALDPLVAPTWTQTCGSRTVTFNATVPTTGVPPYIYKWDMGDGTLPYTTLTPTTTHTFTSNGNYNAQLTVNDSVGTVGIMCGTGSPQTRNVIYLVQVVEPISGTISGPSGDQGCVTAGPLHYTSAMAGGAVIAPIAPFQPNAALNYTWSVSPMTGVTIGTPNLWDTNITFASPGTFTISLSVQSIAVPGYVCSASNTIVVTVYAGLTVPSLSFTQTETSGYLPLNDTFTTTWTMGVGSPASPVTLTYDWGDGTANTVINNATSPDVTQHTYTRRSGSLGWKVSITATDTCGNTENVWRYIVILPPPVLGGTTNATPQVGVAPMSVNFAVNATGGVPTYRFRWDFGDGNSSTDQNPSHIYSTPGTYNPSVQIGDNWPCDDPGISPACDAYVGVDPYMTGHWTAPIPTGPITVYAQLSVQAAVNPALGMVGTTSFGFTSTVAGGDGAYTYLWNFGDGQTSTGANPFHIYNNPGTYSAVLTVNDGAGHVGTSNAVLVTVYPNLNVTGSVNPTTVYPLPGSVTVTANALGGDGNYSYYYQWESFEGFEGPFTGPTANSRNHQYTTSGTHNIQVQVIDGLSNVAYLASALVVTSYDLLTLSINGTPVGSGDYVPKQYTFTSSVAGGSGGNNIAWNFGDGATGAGAAPSHTYNVPGTYSVTATVTDSVSHVAASNTINITVYGVMTVSASATPQQLFVNQPFTFNAAALGGDGVYDYAWSFTDGATATGSTVNLSFATAGSKTATVTVTDGAGHSASASVTVTVWNTLTVSASATPTSGNKSLVVAFSSSAAGGAGGYTYAWDFGDGSASTQQNPSKTYTVAGIYFAKVTVKDSANNTVVSDNIQITVYELLTVSLSGTPTSGTLPLPVTFTAVAAGGDGHYTYSYNYGDGSPVSANPNHTYTTAGTYTAMVTVTDTASHTATSNSVTITVWGPLAVSITSLSTEGVIPFNPGLAIGTLTGGDGAYTYFWNFGDGTTSTSATPTKSYMTAGNFSVTLTVTDGSSHSATSNTINITAWAPLSVTLSGTPTSGTLPLPVTFAAVAAGGDGHYSYSYDYGDGSTGSSANHIYTTAGTYTAMVTVTDTASHTATSNNVAITVWAPMTASIVSDKTTGVGNSVAVTFTRTVAGGDGFYSYSWNFGDGLTSTSSSTSVTHNYAPGLYAATLTVSDGSSHVVTSNTINIAIYAPMSVSASASPQELFVNQPFTFNAIAAGGDGIYSYAWSFSDGTTGTGATVNKAFATAGSKTATVTVTDSIGGTGHTATTTVTVTVWNALSVSASATPTSGNKPLAVSFSSTAAGGSGGYTYAWDFGDGSTSASQNPSKTYAVAGIYFARVTVKDSANNTVTSENIQITVYEPMSVSLSGTPTSGTLPLPVTFTAVAAGGDGHYTYSYDFGDGSVLSSDPNHTYTTAGSYTASVTVTDTASHTATSNTVAITVWAPMTASISSGGVTSGTTPLTVSFTSSVAGGNGSYTYLWNFGDGTTASTANPTKIYTTAGNYSVTLLVTDGASHTANSNTINMTTWAPLTVSSSATPTVIIVGNSITFDALAQGGNGVYTYTWTFGDGTTATGATVNHVYAVGSMPNFTYTAHVSVADTAGHTVTGGNIVVTVKPVPPTILGAQKLVPPEVPSWRLKLTGTNFQNGITVTISGTPVNVTFKNGGEIILKDCKSLCPQGVAVPIVATNPDGGISATFMYTRGIQP